MKLDLAYDKKTGLFRSAIEIPNVVDVRADAIYNMVNMLCDQFDFINDVITVVQNKLTDHEVVGCIAQEHNEKTLESFMIFAVDNDPSVIKIAWGSTINRVDIFVYEPCDIHRKINTIHGSIHLHFEHETAPRMKCHSDNNPLVEELIEKLQEHVIDGYEITITEFKPDGEKEE